jgi:hypothetical protein
MPRAFADKDRDCFYVTTDYGSSDDEPNGAKPPEHRIPRDAQYDSAAAFAASRLTCDEQSLCTKFRRKANETFVQTISTGVPGRDLDMKVMFDLSYHERSYLTRQQAMVHSTRPAIRSSWLGLISILTGASVATPYHWWIPKGAPGY